MFLRTLFFRTNDLTDNKKIWLSLLGSSKELRDIPTALKEDKAFQAYFEGSRMAGFAEGKAEGLTEGITAGKAEGVAEVVKNMKGLDFSVEDIARATGLSREVIESL